MSLRCVAPVALLIGTLASDAAADLPLPQQAELRLARELPKLPSTRPWRLRLSPPIPAQWPPDGAVFYYGYGSAFDPALKDGERVAEAWGRLLVTRGVLAPEVERLAPEVKDAGVQGTRPLSGGEAKVMAGADRVAKRVLGADRKDPEAASDAEVRAFYCLWAKTNVVAAGILARHSDLVVWLGCPAAGHH